MLQRSSQENTTSVYEKNLKYFDEREVLKTLRGRVPDFYKTNYFKLFRPTIKTIKFFSLGEGEKGMKSSGKTNDPRSKVNVRDV